ncbi:MAG: signal peptidase I [Planctomycetales bacterium]|nr:signal peptidase I [Planctomycetales bacterium]
MSKKTSARTRREQLAGQEAAGPSTPGGGWHALRETIESIVIAFVLAFLFRTFEAEAFVIPTGSMSPSLQGQHKDVCCSECGYRFLTTASSEGEDRDRLIARLNSGQIGFGERQNLQYSIAGLEVVTGMCPMCRQTMALRTDLPDHPPEYLNLKGIEQETSYPGDRILVNKYCYLTKDPDRWDVVVFKFPGNGEMNYIKRMIGLPGEELQIYQGDVFMRALDSGAEFRIQRKPPEKQLAMFQTVHDTDYESATLYNAGWPLRWASTTPDSWQVAAEVVDRNVRQQYKVESGEGDSVAWLRYHHLLPSSYDWTVARKFAETGNYGGTSKEQWLDEARPQLIRDFNAYNARMLRREISHNGWTMPDYRYGMHWVSDLAVQCEVEIDKTQGELLLDLVEAGKHFTCRIDLSTGQARLAIDGLDDYQPTAESALQGAGSHTLLFANVDDQLLLWIDDELVEFGDTAYDPESLYGDRSEMIPRTSEDDPGDLEPVGIGARGASLTVNRLQVLRDIYYVATSWRDAHNQSDYEPLNQATQAVDGTHLPALRSVKQLFTDPAAWPRFAKRQHREFEVNDDQFFVMGDNSPESLDCRLWLNNPSSSGIPGGPYLDRRLLTGKAVCVFWPHSWGSIPGLQKLPGFPNFGDMRLVR